MKKNQSIYQLIFSRLNLHPTSGIITVKTSGGPNWDREQVSKHFLTVEARDDLGFGNRNTAQIIVNIEDVNDNPPIFTQSKYEARLMENHLDFDEPLRVNARDADLNGNVSIEEIIYSVKKLYSHFYTKSLSQTTQQLAR